MSGATCNVILNSVLNRRFEYEDPWLKDYIKTNDDVMDDPKVSLELMSLTLFYWLRHFPSFKETDRFVKQSAHHTLGNSNVVAFYSDNTLFMI